jgi:hypothetical protein
MHRIFKSGTQQPNETGHNAFDKKSVTSGRGLNRILQTRRERQHPKRRSKRLVWHAHGGVARTVSRFDFSRDAANGALEKEQPNDGPSDTTLWIAAATTDALKAKAKLGYRAANLLSIAKTLKQGFPSMDDLWEMDPAEAKNKLLTLRGIGDYSADIVVPGMGFPLDVWSAKIFHILFFGKEPENSRQAIPVLKQAAEERWGKWRGYVFVYVLNDLPELSKRVGVDLTQF